MSQIVDDAGFTDAVTRHERELIVHCYRMTGSHDDARELVQETFLRAWSKRSSYEGRASVRTWLYRIATNLCLDTLAHSSRRVLPYEIGPPAPAGEMVERADLPWLQPFPTTADEPAEAAVARETIELAFIVALQHLPPRQRCALVLRDVLGWPAADVAATLDATVPSTNSALQRARDTMRAQLPPDRSHWSPAHPSADEIALARRYAAAVEAADVDAVVDLLAPDVRATMPPWPYWMADRESVREALTQSWEAGDPSYVGRFRIMPLVANGSPAAASYTRLADHGPFLPFAIGVLRVEHERIVEMTAFHDTSLFAAFGLPGEHR